MLYPLAVLIRTTVSFKTLETLLGRGPWEIALLATLQSLASVALALVIGIPIASVLSRFTFPGRSFLWAFVTIPFVLPTVVVALGFNSLLGGSVGPGLLLVVLAHAYINIAVIVRVVGAQWATIDRRLLVIARTLGSSPWQVFRSITLPLLRPSILVAACVIFVFSFTSLGIVIILGDGSTTRTLEQSILRQTSVLLNFPGAVASAILQLAVVTTVLVIAARARGRAGNMRSSAGAYVHTLETPKTVKEKLWVVFVASATFLVISIPIASIIVNSITSRSGFTLTWWASLPNLDANFARFGSPLNSLMLSLGIAAATGLIAALVGGAIAVAVMGRNPFIAFLSLIPLGLSAATVGLGTLLAFGRPPLDLRDTGLLIPIAHALVAVPLVVAIAAPALRSADPRRLFVASSLGARPNKAWWTAYGGLIRGVMLAAGGLAGAVSLGEFGAASFLARADSQTVPLQIAKLLTRPGDQAYATAAVLSVILISATLTLMLFVDRLNSKAAR
jgi:thiamine transport system permease protein